MFTCHASPNESQVALLDRFAGLVWVGLGPRDEHEHWHLYTCGFKDKTYQDICINLLLIGRYYTEIGM